MPQKTKQKITKDTNIRELITKYPQTTPILLEYGLHCVGCTANIYDTMELGARAHGLSDQGIKEMIENINKVL